MKEIIRNVTLWLAWYIAEEEAPATLRPVRLKMLYATSEHEARAEVQRWLEQRGQTLNNLERLEPSPYGFQFQMRDTYPGSVTLAQESGRPSNKRITGH